MPEVVATYDPGVDITCEAGGAITGGRFVMLPTSRNTGGPAGVSDTGDGTLVIATNGSGITAGNKVFGVASHDAAQGRKVNVMRGPKVVPVEVASAIAIGVPVYVAADGRATATAGAGVIAGYSLNVTTTAGQFAQVALSA